MGISAEKWKTSGFFNGTKLGAELNQHSMGKLANNSIDSASWGWNQQKTAT
jgi:hypothetical protein